MMRMFRCEFMKTRRCYIFLTALVISALGICWGLYGNYTDVILKHGWRMFLYQMPLVNAIFLPLLSMVVSSRICNIEHKGLMLKQLCCMESPGKLYDVKLLYGLGIICACVITVSYTHLDVYKRQVAEVVLAVAAVLTLRSIFNKLSREKRQTESLE